MYLTFGSADISQTANSRWGSRGTPAYISTSYLTGCSFLHSSIVINLGIPGAQYIPLIRQEV